MTLFASTQFLLGHSSVFVCAVLLLLGTVVPPVTCQPSAPVAGKQERVEISSDGWKIIGDLILPEGAGPFPVVLLLNAAAHDRTPYKGLSEHLAQLGIASLRLDLRGHGESINLGKFVPGGPRSFIVDAHLDVDATLRFLKTDKRIDPARIGIVGASYSATNPSPQLISTPCPGY